MRRGENKILLSACRQYFSNVIFLCVLFFQTEKLFSRQSGWYSGNILRKSQMSCDKLLRNFLSSSSVSLSRLASRPAMTRLINEVWAGTRHITRRIKEDTIVHKARIEETFSTFYPADSLQRWIKKNGVTRKMQIETLTGLRSLNIHTQNPRGRKELIPDCADPGSRVNMFPMCRLLSYPFLTQKYAESMNEKKCRDSYVSFPAWLLEAICLA